MNSFDYDGTLVLLPKTGTILYPGSSVHCTIEYVLGANDIANKVNEAFVQINCIGSLVQDKAANDLATKLRLEPKPGLQENVLSKDFYLIVDATNAGAAAITADMAGVATRAKAEFEIAKQSPDISFAIDHTCIPANKKNDMKLGGNGSSLVVRVTVRSKATDERQSELVPGYVIHWYSRYENGAFYGGNDQPGSVRLFVGDSSTAVKDFSLTDLAIAGTKTVIGETDDDGVATLTLVPTKEAACVGVSAIWKKEAGILTLPIISIFVEDGRDLDVPVVQAEVDADGNYNLDLVEGWGIPVSLPTGRLALDEYDVFLFNNYQDLRTPVNADTFQVISSTPDASIPLMLSKSVVNSVSVNGADARNQLFFVVSSPEMGVLTSLINDVGFVGNVGTYKPNPDPALNRQLLKPTVNYAGDYINVNTIRSGLPVTVPLVAPTGELKELSVGDEVTTTVYFSGWQSGNLTATGNVIAQTKKITASEISAKFMTVTFNSESMYGFGSDPQNSQKNASLEVDYYIVPQIANASDKRKFYSLISDYKLNTRN